MVWSGKPTPAGGSYERFHGSYNLNLGSTNHGRARNSSPKIANIPTLIARHLQRNRGFRLCFLNARNTPGTNNTNKMASISSVANTVSPP